MPSGRTLASDGTTRAPGAAEVAVRGPGGALGSVRAVTLRPHRFVAQVSRLTGSDVALLRGGTVVATTADLSGADLPQGEGTADVGLPDGDARARPPPPRAGQGVRVAVLRPRIRPDSPPRGRS